MTKVIRASRTVTWGLISHNRVPVSVVLFSFFLFSTTLPVFPLFYSLSTLLRSLMQSKQASQHATKFTLRNSLLSLGGRKHLLLGGPKRKRGTYTGVQRIPLCEALYLSDFCYEFQDAGWVQAPRACIARGSFYESRDWHAQVVYGRRG